MPLPGGPSDKFGNRYELWWTISQLIGLLQASVDSIRIEDPGLTKAEFLLVRGGVRELHQAKRSNPDGKWTLTSLAASDVQLLQAIYTQLSGNDARFVFVSSSDAGELRELSQRAQNAVSLDEFEKYFLEAHSQRSHFEKLRKCWDDLPPASAYDILRRVEVRTIDEKGIQEQVSANLRALFLVDPSQICSELRALAEDSIHCIVTRETVLARLTDRGFQLRRITAPETAIALVKGVTDKYLSGIRNRLIGGGLIPRPASQQLLARIQGNRGGTECVLTGTAGVGKTACIIETLDALERTAAPPIVLAFRLDRLAPGASTSDLGNELGLEESPALVLEAAASTSGRDAVLVIDQLDAVSTASGRSSDLYDAVGALLTEVRGLRARTSIHVVLTCRLFDWENDHRLRHLLSYEDCKIQVEGLSIDQVKNALSSAGFQPQYFDIRQLQLLQLPQNLSLLLESALGSSMTPTFLTGKELFDSYWEAKRRAVASRVAPQPDEWADVITLLCDEMTATQQLSVPRERLDRIAPEYLSQMASEGVLTYDGRRYGFGHESFFDYCFARSFVSSRQPLTEFLLPGEQHLFRRAQVRQVLSYLRDSDRQRYCAELNGLLAEPRIRIHLKDLSLAIAFSVPDPDDQEWEVLEPYWRAEFAEIGRGGTIARTLASLAWQHFFNSTTWFPLAERHGAIASWLSSNTSAVVNTGITYLRIHQHHSPDRVASFMEPFVGKGGEWTSRLRYLMEWAPRSRTVRFHKLFLRLVDDGTLDDARDRFASNGTFWLMLHGLEEAQPDLYSEVVSHWIRRRLKCLLEKTPAGSKPDWQGLFGHDAFLSESLHEAATMAASAFVQNVLPAILEVSDAAIYDSSAPPPRRDAVWPAFFVGDHLLGDSACVNALVAAMEVAAKQDPEPLRNAIPELRRRQSYTANYLLLNAFRADPSRYASESVNLLGEEPWRLQCGVSDNSYWTSIQLIKAVFPLCSTHERQKLEDAIVGFSTEFERSASGYKYKLRGHGSYELLAAIPVAFRGGQAQAAYEQLERKFEKPESAPTGIRGGIVGSPIEMQAARKMDDEQWLRAIAKYTDEGPAPGRRSFLTGGAFQLAGVLKELVVNEPERFAHLSLSFPKDTNPAYIRSILAGITEAEISQEIRMAVCRKAFADHRIECGASIADTLGALKEPLTEDAVAMLDWLATAHPEPEKEMWNEMAPGGTPYYGGDILTFGINTARGRAAEAIRDLIFLDAGNILRFRNTIDRLVRDRSISVRACAASTLLAVAQHDSDLALSLFQALAEPEGSFLCLLLRQRRWIQRLGLPLGALYRVADNILAPHLVMVDRLLATEYADQLIWRHLEKHFSLLRPLVEEMLRSTIATVSTSGARLSGLGALYHERAAASLVKEASTGKHSQRLGVAQVASHNIHLEEHRVWATDHLLLLFNDANQDVRREAASCFLRLKTMPLEYYQDLFQAFCGSLAYQEDSFPVLHLLEETIYRVPEITTSICETFLARFAAEARDIRTRRAGDAGTVVKLAFRNYQQHQNDDLAKRCLDVIDLMCLEGLDEVRRGFADYDR